MMIHPNLFQLTALLCLYSLIQASEIRSTEKLDVIPHQRSSPNDLRLLQLQHYHDIISSIIANNHYVTSIEGENDNEADLNKKNGRSSAKRDNSLLTCLYETPGIQRKHFDLLESPYPTLHQTNEMCSAFGEDLVRCDYKLWADEVVFDNACEEVGGKTHWIKLDWCTPPAYPEWLQPFLPFYYIDEDGDDHDELRTGEMHIVNYPVCAHSSCTTNIVQNLVNSQNINMQIDCPKDSKRSEKFAFKVISPVNESADQETIMTKTCQWLAKRPPSKIKKICSAKKFQIFKNDYLPASQMCRKTCNEYCIKERKTAKFLLGWEIDDDGKYVPITRPCSYLSKLNSNAARWEACNPNLYIFDTKYLYGRDVCTDSCVPPDTSFILTPCMFEE